MNKTTSFLLLIALFIATPLFAELNRLVILPRAGQSDHQRGLDSSYCHHWSRTETGINPDLIYPELDRLTEAVYGQPTLGKPAKKMASGAAFGSIAGAAGAHLGAGAAQGALNGLASAGNSAMNQYYSEEDQLRRARFKQDLSNLEEHLKIYHRAFMFCMDEKNYSVKNI